MTLDKYLLTMRWVAGVAIFITGYLEAVYYPGVLNLVNGAAVGLVIYALWRA